MYRWLNAATLSAASDAHDGGKDPYFVSLVDQMTVENDAFDEIMRHLS